MSAHSTESEEFDPVGFRAEQRATWNAQSGAWAAWQEEFERGAGPVTGRLLELAGLREGQRVLDLATGHGEPALSAARAVGVAGHVVGLDLAPAMVEVARRRAAEVGDTRSIDFAEGDLESLESIGLAAGSFDVVLSRFGLMFAVDHVAAFRGVARVLRPGGVLVAAVWGPPATHLLSTGPAALAEHLEMPAPPPGRPGPFSMSDPLALAAELAAAGLTGVSVTEVVAPFRFGSVATYVRFNREVLPATILDEIRDRHGSPDAPEAWDAVARAVEEYVDADGTLPLPSTALCLRAVATV